MSNSTAAAGSNSSSSEAGTTAKKSKKTLLIVVIAALVLVAGGAGAVVFYMKKSAAAAAAAAQEEEEDGGGEHSAQASHAPKVDPKHPPAFLPLEPFIVNLADKESDRYAQIGITLQVQDPAAAEKLKAFMPAVRNSILLVLTHKTSHELLEREGKQALAEEIMREAVRPMGIHIEPPAKEPGHESGKDAEAAPKRKKSTPKVVNPIEQVHFSNFIIQ
jgi:flagellar protein FliL